MAKENFPIFEVTNNCHDVFLKLEYLNKESMNLGDLLNCFKNDVSDQNDDKFVSVYARRLGSSYEVIGRFTALPIFPPHVNSKLLVKVLKYKDLVELNHQQLYTINENGNPVLALTRSQYGIDYYFNQRKIKHDNLTVLNVYNPNEHVINLDCSFSTAMCVVEEESIAGETFYICDEWAKDVRNTINEDAEIAFNKADEVPQIKNFRDFAINDIVLVKNSGYVRRGCILSCINNVFEVLYVDYGIKIRCSTGQLRIAPSGLAYINFLAIPCILRGIEISATKVVRKFVNEMIHQLGRNRSELVVLKKDTKSLQYVDIIFEEKLSGTKISIADYLNKNGLIQIAKLARMNCTYDFFELLKLAENASEINLNEAASSIQRPFLKPSEFLVQNELAKKLRVSF